LTKFIENTPTWQHLQNEMNFVKSILNILDSAIIWYC